MDYHCLCTSATISGTIGTRGAIAIILAGHVVQLTAPERNAVHPLLDAPETIHPGASSKIPSWIENS